MADIDWDKLIADAYKFGFELGILGELSPDMFRRNLDIEKIKASAVTAREVRSRAIEFYRKRGADEDFLNFYRGYIDRYEHYSVGQYLTEIAIKNKLAFEVDWKCGIDDFIPAVREVLPDIPGEVLNENTQFRYPYELADKINEQYLMSKTNKVLVWYRMLDDSYGFMLIPKAKLDILKDNGYIEFIY